jgi:Holliday junction resolvasome RuvABC endonuclease subunit
MKPNILALDLATKTGYALRENGLLFSGVQVFDVKRGESPGMRFLRLTRFLDDTGTNMKPGDLLVYEQAHHRGGAATQCCVGLMTHALSWAAANGIEHAGVHTATLKKWATGSGKGDKNAMKTVAAAMLGRDPIDDNEADAVLLLAYAEAELMPKNQTKEETKQ